MGPRKKAHRRAQRKRKMNLSNFRFQEEEAERKADYNKVAEMRYNSIPKLAKRD